MARKDASIGFDRVIGNVKAAAEDTPKEKVNKVAAESKPKTTKARKSPANEKAIVFSARVNPDAAMFVKDYAYTKRISLKEALETIIYDYKDRYEKNAKNEPIIKKDR